MTEKTKEIEGIGTVRFVKSKRAKNIGISLKAFGGVKVTVPYLVSYKSAEKVLLSKKNWINKHLPKIQSQEKSFTIFDENTKFKTNLHQVFVKKGEQNNYSVKRTKTEITAIYPENGDVSHPEFQKIIRKEIENSWRMEAKSTLPERTKIFANQFNFNYQVVSIRNTKTKWGSCSHDNKINYTLHLMRLPIHLQDYVILHELCHTIEKNHQKPFWDLMAKVTNGKANEWNKELKNYSTRIY